MKNTLKKLWKWLRCEGEYSLEKTASVPPKKAFKYSELISKYPLRGRIGDEDIVQISHKKSGGYETCYVTIRQLRGAMRGAGRSARGKKHI